MALEFLLYLSRHIESKSLLLVLTYRSEEITPVLGTLLTTLVRERHAVTRSLQLLAAGGQLGDGERPERGCGRDAPALVHIAREYGSGALERCGPAGWRGRRDWDAGRSTVLGRGQHVGLGDPTTASGALHAAEINALLGRYPPRHR